MAMVTLISNIKRLVGVRKENKILRGSELAELPSIENAFLIIEDGRIAGYGAMSKINDAYPDVPPGKNQHSIDASDQLILPCWCDSHTHLVFAASREDEFVDKIKGLSYGEIAARGGGILNSAKKLNETSEDELFNLAWQRLEEVSRLGTGAVEIKSGYGLSVAGELKILRVIKKLREKSNVLVKSTFLGAHAYPVEYRENHAGYIDVIVNEMLPAIAKEK